MASEPLTSISETQAVIPNLSNLNNPNISISIVHCDGLRTPNVLRCTLCEQEQNIQCVISIEKKFIETNFPKNHPRTEDEESEDLISQILA
ncbi:6567_t:CDS:2 [Funneliformis geosporum]|nr:6567_t:CDS:2 [Funneliformis geosporum]